MLTDTRRGRLPMGAWKSLKRQKRETEENHTQDELIMHTPNQQATEWCWKRQQRSWQRVGPIIRRSGVRSSPAAFFERTHSIVIAERGFDPRNFGLCAQHDNHCATQLYFERGHLTTKSKQATRSRTHNRANHTYDTKPVRSGQTRRDRTQKLAAP